MTNSSPAAAQYADTGGLLSTQLASTGHEPPAAIELAAPMHTGWLSGGGSPRTWNLSLANIRTYSADWVKLG